MVKADLEARGSAAAYLRALHEQLIAGNLKKQGKAIHNLGTRSGWYELIHSYRERESLSEAHGGLNELKRIIDLQYNRKVAKSLGAERLREEEENLDVAAILCDSHLAETFQRGVTLIIDDASRDRWLTWAKVEERLSADSGYANTERVRMQRLRSLVEDHYAHQLSESKLMIFVRRGVKGINSLFTRGAGGALGAATAHSVGGGLPAAVGGLLLGSFTGGSCLM